MLSYTIAEEIKKNLKEVNAKKVKVYDIIQVKKIQEFDVIQVLFKPSSIFQRFDWYNNHSQGEDVEWKIYITV